MKRKPKKKDTPASTFTLDDLAAIYPKFKKEKVVGMPDYQTKYECVKAMVRRSEGVIAAPRVDCNYCGWTIWSGSDYVTGPPDTQYLVERAWAHMDREHIKELRWVYDRVVNGLSLEFPNDSMEMRRRIEEKASNRATLDPDGIALQAEIDAIRYGLVGMKITTTVTDEAPKGPPPIQSAEASAAVTEANAILTLALPLTRHLRDGCHCARCMERFISNYNRFEEWFEANEAQEEEGESTCPVELNASE